MVILGQFNHQPTVKQKHIWFNFNFLISSPTPYPHLKFYPFNLRSQIKCKQLISGHSEVENFSMENFKYEVFLGAIMRCWGVVWGGRKIRKLFSNVLWTLGIL